MKTKIILTITTIFISAAQLVAQPLPPTGPNGNPVPLASSFGFFALLAGLLFIYFKNKKTTDK